MKNHVLIISPKWSSVVCRNVHKMGHNFWANGEKLDSRAGYLLVERENKLAKKEDYESLSDLLVRSFHYTVK